MPVFSAVLIGIATGIVFGFVLEKSRVFEPGLIVGQMQLRSFVMLKVFLAAVITGLVVLAGTLVLLERARPWRDELGEDVDGVS